MSRIASRYALAAASGVAARAAQPLPILKWFSASSRPQADRLTVRLDRFAQIALALERDAEILESASILGVATNRFSCRGDRTIEVLELTENDSQVIASARVAGLQLHRQPVFGERCGHISGRLETGLEVAFGEDGAQAVALGVRDDAAGNVDEASPVILGPPSPAAQGRPVDARGRHGERHCLWSRADSCHGFRRRQRGQIETRVAKGDGVRYVGGRVVAVLRPGASDVGQALQQRAVALGGIRLGVDLGPQGRELPLGLAIASHGALSLLDCRDCHLPPRWIIGLIAGLVTPRPGRGQQFFPGRGMGRALLVIEADAGAANTRKRQHGGGQSDRQPSPMSFYLGPFPLLFGPGLCLDPFQLGTPQAVLHPGEVGSDSRGNGSGTAQAVVTLRCQATPGELDQFRLGAAVIQAAERVIQLAPTRLSQRLARAAAGECRTAGEDFAKDRPESEHIRPLVQRIDLTLAPAQAPYSQAFPAPNRQSSQLRPSSTVRYEPRWREHLGLRPWLGPIGDRAALRQNLRQ